MLLDSIKSMMTLINLRKSSVSSYNLVYNFRMNRK